MSTEKSKYNIDALARGLELLALFNKERPRLQFNQIVELAGMNKSTVFRVLATLEGSGYLERDPDSRYYRPGIRVLQLGFTAINSLEIGQVARPHLEQLSQKLDETVSLAILDEFRTIYIDRIRNRSIVGVVLNIGSSLPAHCSSLGKMLLANLPEDRRNKLIEENELVSYTTRTRITKEDLILDLDEIRGRGYAIGDEELAAGLRAVSAPIQDASKRTIAAVNVTGQVQTMSYDRIHQEVVPALLETVSAISRSIGNA